MSNASTHAQTECQSEKWPTPKPNEWQVVQLVAVRAFTTLDWALSTLGAAHPAVMKRDSLICILCYFLKCLLAGHLLDLDLDVQQLFKIGLRPVLDAELDGHAESEGLAAMMLSRLAIDSRLALQGRACARQICYIYGESSQSTVSCHLFIPVEWSTLVEHTEHRALSTSFKGCTIARSPFIL